MQLRRRLGWRDVIVGLVVAVAMILLMLGILAVGGESGGFWTRRVTYYTTLPTASGLYVGSLVMLDGIEVGSVRRLTFNPEGPGIRVYFTINARFQDRIRQDSVIAVRNLGLLGDRYVDIRSGHPEQPILPPGHEIPAVEAFDYSQMAAQLVDRLEDVQETLGRLNRILAQIERGEGLLGALIADPSLKTDFQRTLHAVARGQGTLGKLLQDDTLYENLTHLSQRLMARDNTIGLLLNDSQRAQKLARTVDRIDEILNRLEQGEGTLGKMFNDNDLYQEIHQLVQRVNTLLDPQVQPQGTLARMLQDPDLYNDLVGIVRDVQQLIQDVRKNPKKYFAVKIALIAF